MLIAGLFAVAACIVAWYAQGWFWQALRRYRSLFEHQAHHRLREFFLFLDPAQLWWVNVGVCASAALVLYGLTSSVWLMLAAAACLLAAPQWVLARMRRRRWTRFENQLPDLLLALAGALRSGSGVQTALRYLIPQSPAPLSEEFGLMLREQRLGVSFEQALAQLYRRMPSEGMGLVVSSLTIALQNGGNLAETLERIAQTLRARLQLLGRIRALTAQGRLQAWIMSGLPVILASVLSWIDAEAMAPLWQSPQGWGVLGVIVGLEFAGVMMVRRIVNVEV